MITLYDTLSGKKKALPDTPKLRLFVCGPTVYDHPHIGNARTFVTFDMLVRYLRSRKMNVFYLQNITDVDDKIIERAAAEKTMWEEVARRYEKIFLTDMKALDVISVDRYARATDFIPEIVRQIKTLIEKKHAYLIEGDGWYFDLATFPDYGKLARRTVTQAEDAMSRIDASDRKRNRGDFALWKFSKLGEPSWPSEDLGAGRPGWHIEDTAITEHFFGPQYEVHGGGIDIKFPHHEAEIAQQESASGLVPFVRTWMHVGHLTVNGEKMSKSLKNFVTIEELLKRHSPSTFRMMVFMHHYRSPLDYTDTLAETARKNVETISVFLAKLKIVAQDGHDKENGVKISEMLEHDVRVALEDDFNTPKALAAVFEHIAKHQKKVWEMLANEAKAMAKGLEDLFATFGITVEAPKISEKAKKLANERETSRGSKQFEQSDRLRKQIEELGYEVEDTPRGPFLWPKNPN